MSKNTLLKFFPDNKRPDIGACFSFVSNHWVDSSLDVILELKNADRKYSNLAQRHRVVEVCPLTCVQSFGRQF